MGLLRSALAPLMAVGVLSPGQYSILTGLVLMYLTYLLGTGATHDPAAPFVAVGLAVTGLWQLERGLRTELQRRRRSSDGTSC